MSGRIGVDVISRGELNGTEREHFAFGDLQVVDHHVEVELLRSRRIRPSRPLVIGRELKREA
jgi:hypothetical protein